MNRNVKKFVLINVGMAMVFVAFMAVTLVAVLAPRAQAQEAVTTEGTGFEKVELSDDAKGMAFLSAAIVMCVSCVAAGVAVGMTGSAAIGAVAERPELMGRTILVVGLAEGIAIYGLIIAIMIIGKV